MSRSRVLLHLVRADFLERVRRYSFLLSMACSVYFGYAIYAGQISLRLNNYQGVANSAWLGSVAGLVGSVFLSLVGFYVVKNTIQRDRETRVGRILAATPLSKTLYTLGKALSNFAVLGAMVLILAAEAIVIQWTHKGQGPVHLFDLLAPLLVFGVCSVSVTAALAVLFETIPGLRGGLGNIVYFFLWCFLISMSVAPLVSGKPPSTLTPLTDYAGIANISGQMQAQVRQLDPEYKGGSSFTVGSMHHATKSFLWQGLRWTPAILVGRVFWLGVAVGLTLLAAVLFDRFDPAQERLSFHRAGQGKRGRQGQAIAVLEAMERMPPESRAAQLTASDLTPLAYGRKRSRFLALVLAELRLLLGGRAWWWYTVAAGLFAACLFAPLADARSGVILAAWLWPTLLWSQLGTREGQFSTQALIFSSPHAFPRQLLASWSAGVLLAAITGGGLGLQLVFARDGDGLFAWAMGAMFIATLALMLGVCTGSPKTFEAIYAVWWYIGPLHHLGKLDFIGTNAASSNPTLYLAASMGLLLVACFWRSVRLSRG
jgi:hypothetical protein